MTIWTVLFLLLTSAFAEEPAVFKEDPAKTNISSSTIDQNIYWPLFFDPAVNGVQMSLQAIDYDLTNPNTLRMGPLDLQAQAVELSLTRERGEFTEFDFGFEVQTTTANMYVLSFRWPADFIPDGQLELIDDQSKVLWRRKIEEKDTKAWQELVQSRKPLDKQPELTKEEKKQKLVRPRQLTFSKTHLNSTWGLWERNIFEFPIVQIKEPFRFCLNKTMEDGRLALCSKRYKIVREAGRFYLDVVSKDVRPRVLVNDKPVAVKGSAIFLDNHTPIKFAALLGSGTYYEFFSSPKPITIVDMVLNEETGLVEVVGYGHQPMGDIEKMDREKVRFLDFLNFVPTIGKTPEFWRTKYPKDEPYIYVRGNGGAPFKQSFVYDSIPKKRDRVYVDKSSPTSTYARTVKIKGVTEPKRQVASKEESAKMFPQDKFEWTYLAKNGGESNRSILLVTDQNKTWKASHDVYRGYPREFGLRLTGVVSDQFALVLLGEVAGQMWFEDVLWMNSRLLTQQRWGVAAKYFQSLVGIGGKTESDKLVDLKVSTLDLKYRLSQGVWGQDPTVGLILGYQNFTLASYKASMLGVGAFWARSMPSWFDAIFNVVPWFRYPKWVDVESIAYVVPGDNKTQLDTNVSTNFHGKIQWTKSIYGEAGFGIKVFGFRDLQLRKRIGVGLAYGTVGLGYNF